MQTTLFICIALYLLATLLVGAWVARKVSSTQDFVVAGRQLSLFVAASAMFATWFGSETVMGASSEFVEHGLIGVIEDPFGAALCLFLVGVFFARPLYRMNILTFNDYFKIRFGRKAELISAFFMIPSYFGWIAAQLVAMSIILKVVAGIPLEAGIIACTVVVAIYTYLGGMWSVSITDAVQTVIIISGLLFFLGQLMVEAGGMAPLWQETPEGFFRFWPEANWESGLEYIAAWITIGLGSIPQQDVFQRVMSARSEQTAVRASYLSSAMYLLVAFIPLVIALYGKILYPELLSSDKQLFLPTIVLEKGSLWLQILFFGALLSAILSTTSGAILAPATVFGENLLRPFYPEVSDKKLLQWMRWSVLGVAFCSAGMALLKSNIYDLVAQSSALSLVSLFVPLVAGLYWKKASNWGALLSMSLGMGVWLWAEFTVTATPSLILGLLASILGMLLGSLFQSYFDGQAKA